MKFEDALLRANEKMKEKNPAYRTGVVSPDGLAAAVLAWNTVAIALANGGLDDVVTMSNYTVQSFPIAETEAKPQNDSDKPTASKRGRKAVKNEQTQKQKAE